MLVPRIGFFFNILIKDNKFNTSSQENFFAMFRKSVSNIEWKPSGKSVLSDMKRTINKPGSAVIISPGKPRLTISTAYAFRENYGDQGNFVGFGPGFQGSAVRQPVQQRTQPDRFKKSAEIIPGAGPARARTAAPGRGLAAGRQAAFDRRQSGNQRLR